MDEEDSQMDRSDPPSIAETDSDEHEPKTDSNVSTPDAANDIEHLTDIPALEEFEDSVVKGNPELSEVFAEQQNPHNLNIGHYRQTDRPRGILSERDRKYLLGEKSYEAGPERKVRKSIRERLYHALLDFSLLAEQLSDNDAEQIFGNLAANQEIEGDEGSNKDPSTTEITDEDLFVGIQNTIVFLTATMEKQEVNSVSVVDDAVTQAFDLLKAKRARDASLYAAFERVTKTIAAGFDTDSEPFETNEDSVSGRE